jgi:signal transduction histidine kinase
MLYFTITFLVFAVFVFLRNPKHPTSYYLMGSILGWCLSFIGLLRYLANLNLSSSLVRYFFYVPYSLWGALVTSHSDIIVSIRIMNAGLVLLIIFVYLYITNVFGGSPKRPSRLLPILPVAAEFLLYDPVFYRALYAAIPGADAFYLRVHPATRIYNLALLVVPTFFLIRRLIAHRRIPVVRYFYLFNTVGITVVILAFALTFHWAPALLARVYPNTTYLVFDMPVYIPNQVFYATYPYLSVLSFTVVLFSLLRYKSIDRILASKNYRHSRMYRHDDFGVRALSHALKNQLLAIKFESEALVSGLPPGDELAESARTIRNLSSDAVDGLNEMYRKIQRRDLVLELTDMNGFIAEWMRKRSDRLPPAVAASFRPSRIAVRALVDRGHIEECLNVSMQNALDAFGEGGGTVEIATELSGIWLIVSVRDDGPGIPADLIHHVGEPFFTTKSSTSNWGLGLSYVKRMLRAHHGYLEVESVEGQGTTVRLYLPVVV